MKTQKVENVHQKCLECGEHISVKSRRVDWQKADSPHRLIDVYQLITTVALCLSCKKAFVSKKDIPEDLLKDYLAKRITMRYGRCDIILCDGPYPYKPVTDNIIIER